MTIFLRLTKIKFFSFDKWVFQKLYYDRIDLSKRLDNDNCNNNKECMVYRYCFFNLGFEFQDCVCSGCQDLTMLFLNINDIAIIIVKEIG